MGIKSFIERRAKEKEIVKRLKKTYEGSQICKVGFIEVKKRSRNGTVYTNYKKVMYALK